MTYEPVNQPFHTVLDSAQIVVDGPRAESYGPPHENHSTTAGLFAGWLHRRHGPNRERIDAIDICAFNILQKLSRLAHSPNHRDSLVDICGYARNWEMLINGTQKVEVANDHQRHLTIIQTFIVKAESATARADADVEAMGAEAGAAAPVGDGRPAVYLAARYSRNAEMRLVAERLRAHGIVVTSRWIDGGHEMSKEATTEEVQLERARFAAEDWQDLEAANVVVSFTEEPRSSSSRGGRHVEFGAALAMGKRCIVVGPMENVFHCLSQVEHCEEDMLPWVIRRADPCPADPCPDQAPEPTVPAPSDGVERVTLDNGDSYKTVCDGLGDGWEDAHNRYCSTGRFAKILNYALAQRKRSEAADKISRELFDVAKREQVTATKEKDRADALEKERNAFRDQGRSEQERADALEAALPHWRAGMRMLEYLSPTPRITAILTEARAAGLTWEE